MRAGGITSSTGLGEGSFEVMPTRALGIRGLRITVAWSAEERSALQANATSLVCTGAHNDPAK